MQLSNLYFVAVAAVAASIAGCKGASSEDLVGTWHSAMGGAESTYHFRKDKTFTLESSFAGCNAVATGEYELDGQKLFMGAADSKVTGPEPMAGQMRKDALRPIQTQIKFESPTLITMMPDSPSPIKLTRTSPTP